MDGVTYWFRHAAEPRAVPWGRRFAANVLRDWGLEHMSEPVTLIASELLTNAVEATGTTKDELSRGERETLPPDLVALVRDLRAVTTKPICVGFGISTPAHVAEVVRYADGAIVGSAIVRQIETLQGDPALVPKVGEFIAALKAATRDGGHAVRSHSAVSFQSGVHATL